MSAFGEAFKAARKAGKKEFTYNGKRYHTRTKDEETATAAKKATRKAQGNAVPGKRGTAAAGQASRKKVAEKKASASAGGAAARTVRANAVPGKRGSTAAKRSTVAKSKAKTANKRASSSAGGKAARSMRANAVPGRRGSTAAARRK